MRLATVLTIMAILVLSVGCVPVVSIAAASGHTVTRSFDVADFTRVEAGSAFVVQINQGETYSVEISVDERIIDHIEARKTGDTLRISFRPGFSTRSIGLGTLQATVTMPALEGVGLSGASRGEVSGFTGENDLDVGLSGASTLDGAIAASTLRIDASGASRMKITGSARRLVVDGSGASLIDLRDLEAEEADVELSGASRAQIDVRGELGYNLSGGSRLEYDGHPQIGHADTSGGSSARTR